MSDEVEASADISAAKPVLRVVKGDLTSEEVAALVAVIAVRNAAAVRTKSRIRSEWNHPVHLARKPHRVGPDQWRR